MCAIFGTLLSSVDRRYEMGYDSYLLRRSLSKTCAPYLQYVTQNRIGDVSKVHKWVQIMLRNHQLGVSLQVCTVVCTLQLVGYIGECIELHFHFQVTLRVVSAQGSLWRSSSTRLDTMDPDVCTGANFAALSQLRDHFFDPIVFPVDVATCHEKEKWLIA